MNSYLFRKFSRVIDFGAVLLAIFGVAAVAEQVPKTSGTPEKVPVYQVDPAWPKPLPNNWALGPVCGVALDRHVEHMDRATARNS